MEELCSIESRQLVEEHFKECTNCKKLYEQSTFDTVYNRPAKTNTGKKIDYFKRIRNNVNKKNGALFAVLPDFTQSAVPNKIKLPILGIQFAAMTYIFMLMLFVGHNLINNTIPFGMQPKEIGPFVIVQIFICAICFFAAFIATLILSLRKRAICPALCFLPLGGLSLMFEYALMLHKLSSNFELALFIQPFVILTCEITLLVGIYMFVNRRQ